MGDFPTLKRDRLIAALAAGRNHEGIPTDDVGSDQVYAVIYAEIVQMLTLAGIDLTDFPDEVQENLLVAMQMQLTNGLFAGMAYIKLPRRL